MSKNFYHQKGIETVSISSSLNSKNLEQVTRETSHRHIVNRESPDRLSGGDFRIRTQSAQDFVLSIGEVRAFNHSVTITCRQVGACVGIFVWDQNRRISGGACILLPSINEVREQISSGLYYEPSGAISEILSCFQELGSDLIGLRAKIVGGADIFGFGKRNVHSVIAELSRVNIHLEAVDVGGEHCRTAKFNSDNNVMLVRTPSSNFFKIY